MTTSPQERAVLPPNGYVLRGGPLDGAIAHAQRPAFLHIEHCNGDGDTYTPSGHPDAEHPDLERYDFEAMTTDRRRRPQTGVQPEHEPSSRLSATSSGR